MKYNINDFKSNLRKKIDLEIDHTIKEIIMCLNLEDKFYGELNEGLHSFCEINITNNPSVRINTLLLTKIKNYVLVNYQNNNFVIKDETSLISFMEKLSVTVIEDTTNKKSQGHIQIGELDNRYKYNLKLNIPKDTRSIIDYKIVIERSLNNIIQKIFMLSYFELQMNSFTNKITNQI